MRWPSSSSNELGPEPWHTIRLWGNLCNRYAASTWLMVLFLGLLEVLWVTHEIRIWLWTSADFNGDENSVKIMANLWTRVWSFVLLANSDKTGDWWGQVDRKDGQGYMYRQKDGQGCMLAERQTGAERQTDGHGDSSILSKFSIFFAKVILFHQNYGIRACSLKHLDLNS